MRVITIILSLNIILASALPFLAQSQNFDVRALINKKGKSAEASSKLFFGENSLKIAKKRKAIILKEFNYADIKSVEYSNSDTPRFSNGKMIALTALAASTVGGIVVVPLMFMKVKQHWISVRTENDFIVFRVSKKKLRRIKSEFENHNVSFSTNEENISPK